MNIRQNLVSFAAFGMLAAAMPANAQLLGGGINGALGGTLHGTAGGGTLQGGANGNGSLQGELGGIRDTTGNARDVAGEAATRTRDVARNSAERTRGAAGTAATKLQSKAQAVRDGTGEMAASAEGSATAGMQRAVENTETAEAPAQPGEAGRLTLGSGFGGSTSARHGDRHAEADAGFQGEGSAQQDQIDASGSTSGSARVGRREPVQEQPAQTPAE